MIELEFISPQIGLYFNILYVVKLRQELPASKKQCLFFIFSYKKLTVIS